MRLSQNFLAVLILIVSQSLFSTTHEHFTYYFDQTDFTPSVRASLDDMPVDRLGLVKKGQIEAQALSSNPALWTDTKGTSQLTLMEKFMKEGMSYKEAAIRASGRDLYGILQKRISEFVELNGRMPSYKWYNKAVSEITGQTVEEVHRLNFTMDTKALSAIDQVRSISADEIRLNSYMSSDKIRKKILLNLLEDGKKKEALSIFENSLKRIPLNDRRRVVFGLPNEFIHNTFEGQTFRAPDFIKDLREIARKYGSSWEFLTSFVRNQLEGSKTLTGTQYNLDLDQTIKGIREGYLDGIDFAGSIAEENAATTNAEKALNRLKLEFAIQYSSPQEIALIEAGKSAIKRYNSDLHNLSPLEFEMIKGQKKKYYDLIDEITDRVLSRPLEQFPAQTAQTIKDFKEASRDLRNQIQNGIEWHAKILEEVSGNGGVVRFHALEGAWEGIFYDEHFFGNFEKILEKAKTNPGLLPSELFIGHSAGLDEKTNQRLYDLFERLKAARPDMKLIVEMNVTSNAMLQSKLSTQGKTIPQALAETVQELHKKGIRVVVGSDGLGKMGNAAGLEFQLEKLRAAGLSPGDVEKLRLNSVYVPGRLNVDPRFLPKNHPCRDALRQLLLQHAYP